MNASTQEVYIGDELEMFKYAKNWKRYMRRSLAPYIQGHVIEVGAGIGGTTQNLSNIDGVENWLCVEPDAGQVEKIEQLKTDGTIPAYCATLAGILSDVEDDNLADTIIYIDVLEHIENDRAELEIAARKLKVGGRIVVLSPAYPYLFSPFDAAVGHYRRYTRTSLRAVANERLSEVKSFYLDCMGLAASLANKWVLKQDLPTVAQVRTWDQKIVPVSKIFDPLIARQFGRSIIIIWEKTA